MTRTKRVRKEVNMDVRSKYRTKQKEILLDYLETVPGVHITANDVCEHFKQKGSPIGQATIYRQMESFVDEGILNKYVIDGSSPACFEYMGQNAHKDGKVCFHCKCEKCGRLIHLHCDELEAVRDHLYQEHRFKMNIRRTVIYGLCEECSAEL